jgi:hypothetical protein
MLSSPGRQSALLLEMNTGSIPHPAFRSLVVPIMETRREHLDCVEWTLTALMSELGKAHGKVGMRVPSGIALSARRLTTALSPGFLEVLSRFGNRLYA